MSDALAGLAPWLSPWVLAHPWISGAVIGGLFALMVRWMLRTRPTAQTARLENLAAGQQQLAGALTQLAEAQVQAQARLAESLSGRLERAEGRMGESLAHSAARTARSLGALGERLSLIDRAQGRIEDLSSDLMGLNRLLSNKQTRGQFGEFQLLEILGQALPRDMWVPQATLSNGRRVDCLIRLADPPGPLPVDSKFPLEPYEAILAATDDRARKQARAALRTACLGHVRAIAERYILEGETADQAMMFVPSEAVFAEIHASVPDVVRTALAVRVWIVSPTTLMAVLTVIRGVVRDVRIAEEGARVRVELAALARDVARIGEQAGQTERNLRLAAEALDGVTRAASRAGRRAERIEALDFAPETPPHAAE
ncbi:MAG: DNA recombination protein RmuC [Pseudomonadota bacterium]